MTLVPTAFGETNPRVEDALAWAEQTAGKVYRDDVTPQWLPGADQFWYTVATGPGGQAETVRVDALTGAVRRAASSAELSLPPPPETLVTTLPASGSPKRSRGAGASMRLELVNPGDRAVRLWWIDFQGEQKPYGEIAPGAVLVRPTYAGHVWMLDYADGTLLARFAADPARPRLLVDGPAAGTAVRTGRRRAPDMPRSPDGRWEVKFVESDVVLRDLGQGRDIRLTQDGTTEKPYAGPVVWSSDSRSFALSQIARVAVRQIELPETDPADPARTRQRKLDYIKPGDPLPDPTPHVFRLPDGSAPAEAADIAHHAADRALCPVFFTYGQIDFRWAEDGSEVYFDYNQRGHQLYRILALNPVSGATRVVVEERSETFVDYTNKTWRHWLRGGREMLWLSERDGFAHLYAIDTAGLRPPRAVTSGRWVVRSIEEVDEARGVVWFMAGGVRPEEDPYHRHLCRVNFDGTGFVRLTAGDGDHRIQWSPDRRWFVDTWSRADHAPVTELRRSEDGALVTGLERADTSSLIAAGWKWPERFVAPGRDGKTPIYGVIIRPPDFDPTRRYPVVEEVYAGPQDAFAPKSFSRLPRQQALARLGFVVVQADGMGTNHRGRSFHAVAWKNLQDAGFADRIAWIKAAAATRPWMDLARVGIYGGSAGGQSAMRALIDHADFYSVAVADCGCHDNRMDKIWWNEQWLGWPLDESYVASSNVEHAARLRGDLLLLVGEEDSNVDPASTRQVVERLRSAGVAHEYHALPGTGHGAAETPAGTRLRAEFLFRHLQP